jgi:TRAP-type mannitol/chloroaromatic compound transport system permease large subunit
VALALGGIAMLFGWVLCAPSIFNLITAATLSTMTSFILLAVPLFLFMGQILQRSGMGEAMIRAAHLLAGPLRGSLAVGVIVRCSLMGAMVGSVGAGIMTAGSVALEPVLKRGYDLRLALGSIVAAGAWRS